MHLPSVGWTCNFFPFQRDCSYYADKFTITKFLLPGQCIANVLTLSVPLDKFILRRLFPAIRALWARHTTGVVFKGAILILFAIICFRNLLLRLVACGRVVVAGGVLVLVLVLARVPVVVRRRSDYDFLLYYIINLLYSI